MGLLNQKDWTGKWIDPEIKDIEREYKAAPYVRKTFKVEEGLKFARIYQSAHGLYDFWINNQLGSEDKFKPGFTAYYDRLHYQVYDISSLLKTGENNLLVVIGEGWWRGTTGGVYRNNFGYHLGYLCQIHLV